MSRFQTLYREAIVPELIKKFGYKTTMQVPRITKITLNMGVGEAVNDKKLIDNAVADLTKIAGQKPVVTKTRKAIANFKIRENMPIGCMVTLRGERMYDFLDRLITIAFPPRSLSRVFVTSVVSLVVLLTAAATTTSVLKNKSFSLKSSTTRSTRFVG